MRPGLPRRSAFPVGRLWGWVGSRRAHRAVAWLFGPLAAGAAFVALPAVADAASRARIGEFAAPTHLTAPAGDDRRIFVTQRSGRIRLLLDGEERRRDFLDIGERVGTAGEGGLMSMAFAPDYATTGRFYVFYTTLGGHIRVDEFLRSETSSNRASPASMRHVIRVRHRYSDHYGGQLQFGPDGYLYISTGDGAPPENGQDEHSLLGKLLRIDPRPAGDQSYSSPPTNPFVGREGRNEIFAYGLRNPFRFSFDRATGDLILGDVGQARREEIDFQSAEALPGPNFGWACFEGSLEYQGGTSCLRGPSGHTPPVHEISHASGFCSVMGGYVARHHSMGTLEGHYLYGDFCQNELRAVKLTASGSSRDRGIGVGVESLVSFGEDGRGRLYGLSLEGPAYRLSG